MDTALIIDEIRKVATWMIVGQTLFSIWIVGMIILFKNKPQDTIMTNKGEPKNLTFDGYYIDHGAMLALAVDGKVSVTYLERNELEELLDPAQWELQRQAFIRTLNLTIGGS